MFLGKLFALVGTAKGAAVVGLMIAASVGAGVAATNPDVQNAVDSTVQSLTQGADAKLSNQVALVTARNDADNKLRDAFQDFQQRLQKLQGAQVDSSDRTRLTDTVNAAYTALRARLNKAFNDTAALTLGRDGPMARKPTGANFKVAFTSDDQAKVNELADAAIKEMAKIVSDAETAVARAREARSQLGAGRGQTGVAGHR